MANKKSKPQKQIKSDEKPDNRRIRILQILFAIFSIMLILSMVLSLTQ
ncbi:MAG TPA: hypothetical protein VHP14_06800 [Anaerolineales bacterium]|nr:hypothetical protein [Anaerolineales bacterium]